MILWVFPITGMMLFAATAAHASEKRDSFAVDWLCPQADGSNGQGRLPFRASISFQIFQSPSIKLDWSKYRAFLARSESAKYDYFECFLSFQFEVISQLQQRLSKEDAERLLLPIRMEHARLGQKMYEQGMPLFPPMSSLKGHWQLLQTARPSMKLPDLASGLQKAKEIVRTCRLKWRDSSEFLSSEFVTQMLPEAIRGADDSCKREIVSSYFHLLSQAQAPQAVCSPQSKREDCAQIRKGTLQVLEVLSEVFPPESASAVVFNQARACLLTSSDVGEFLKDLQLDLAQADSCTELKPGESRKVSSRETGVPANYTLIRKNSDHFIAELSIDFINQMEGPNSAQKAEEFRIDVNRCLDRVNPKLVGPGGKRLEIRINDTSGEFPFEPPNPAPINLTETIDRADSSHFATNLDCPTLTHEFLHHLGLVDEYLETQKGYVVDPVTGVLKHVENNATYLDFGCRSLGPENSIMHDQGTAYAAVFGGGGGRYTSISKYKCVCDLPNPGLKSECMLQLKRIASNPSEYASQGYCPDDGTYREQMTLARGWTKTVHPHLSPDGLTLETEVAISDGPGPPRESLLFPAQFNVITKPGCLSDNQLYYLCSAENNSTANSRDRLGRGCAKGLPSACRDGSWTVGIGKGRE